MSDARGKAWTRHIEIVMPFPADTPHLSDREVREAVKRGQVYREGFDSGWDAAKADLPSRDEVAETIRPRACCGEVSSDEPAKGLRR